MGIFEGFTLERVDVGPAQLRVCHGGSGPPTLLLHGHPRTHATWHKVAPLLAERFTVVCPDLRGYGQSSKPPTTPDHAPYSKRAMAADCVALMRSLGYSRFCVAGHDRGLYGRPSGTADRLRAPHRRGGAGGTGGLPGRVLRALSAPAYWPSRAFRARALRTA
jgi:pimeloyl-ACP methyl ester carboxylesterase